MSNWTVISDRTKRRRLAAEISDMVSEIQLMENTNDSANLSQTYQTCQTVYGICDPSHSHNDSAYLSHLGACHTEPNMSDPDIAFLGLRHDIDNKHGHVCVAPYSPDNSNPNVAIVGSNNNKVLTACKWDSKL
jgi:hypothetical protein